MITRSATRGGLWCASAMCGRLSHEAATAAASRNVCPGLGAERLEGEAEPGTCQGDEISDGRGVILMGPASEDGFLQEECRGGGDLASLHPIFKRKYKIHLFNVSYLFPLLFETLFFNYI